MVSYKLPAPHAIFNLCERDGLFAGPIIHQPMHATVRPLWWSKSPVANPISLGGMVGRHRSRSGHLAKRSRRILSNEECDVDEQAS